MTNDIVKQEKAGVPHILLATVAFLSIALLAPVLRVIQVLAGA